MKKANEIKADFINSLQDPKYFKQRIFNKHLWSIQADILKSVRDNPRTAVRSCHGIGKTFTAAMCILWFLYTHEKFIVLSTAPTWRQVEKLIWKVDARGAIQIESKEDMKKRLGHSPDRADAVVLACAENNYQGFAMSGGDLYVSKFFR